MRAIVCGGRDFHASIWLYQVLDKMHAEKPFSCIIEGGQRSYEDDGKGGKRLIGGADAWAALWAPARGVELITVPAKWQSLGDRAGPIRNAEMLMLKPDVVIAFPGGRGTEDMIRKAKAAGVKVVEITY